MIAGHHLSPYQGVFRTGSPPQPVRPGEILNTRQRVARHEAMHKRLRAGLEAMGIGYVPKHSLHTLNCIHIPAGADDAAVRKRLLEEYGIEIGGGLGAMAGKAWRIGLMGHGATQRNVDLVLAALREVLATA